MAEKIQTKEQKYEDFIKAMRDGEMGMAKFLWDLIEKSQGNLELSDNKIAEMQSTIDRFIKTFKDRKDGKPGVDGKTPSEKYLLKLIKPLIKPGKDGETPSDERLLKLIDSVMPDPIPGPKGDQGKEGKKGKNGRMPKHEWNGTHIRFELPDGTFGEWHNLQGPPGESNPSVGFVGKTGALERVRGTDVDTNSVDLQGISQIFFGNNITISKIGDGGIRVDATGGGSGPGISFETPDGIVDDSNVTFTVENEPSYIVVNGAQYFLGTGAYAGYSAGVITLAYPVGSGGFIRSAYQVT